MTNYANMTKSEFQAAYVAAFKKVFEYNPNQVGFQKWAAVMAEMTDAHPEWVDEVEAAA